MRLSTLSVLALLAASIPVLAQDNPNDFATVDTDASGAISWAEAIAALPSLTEEAFTAADEDESGELSEDEYLKVLASVAP